MDNSLGLQNSHIRTDITYTQTENTDSLSKLESRIKKLEEEDEEINLALQEILSILKVRHQKHALSMSRSPNTERSRSQSVSKPLNFKRLRT